MNRDSKFDSLTFATKFLIKGALSTINDPKRGIASLSANIEQIASAISWNAEDWMAASYTLQYGNWAAKALELAVLECREAIMGDSSDELEAEFNVMLDERAASIINAIASECLSTIYRGTDRSSNPMTALDSFAKVTAARKAMEALCNLSSHNLTSSEAIADIFSGKERRAEQRREADAKIVRKIVYYKAAGDYHAQMLNGEGNAVELPVALNVTRKGDALTEVAKLVQKMRDRGLMHHVAVEAA